MGHPSRKCLGNIDMMPIEFAALDRLLKQVKFGSKCPLGMLLIDHHDHPLGTRHRSLPGELEMFANLLRQLFYATHDAPLFCGSILLKSSSTTSPARRRSRYSRRFASIP